MSRNEMNKEMTDKISSNPTDIDETMKEQTDTFIDVDDIKLGWHWLWILPMYYISIAVLWISKLRV